MIFVSKILSQDSLLDNRDPHSRGEEREKEEEENIVSSDGGHVVPLSLLHRYWRTAGLGQFSCMTVGMWVGSAHLTSGGYKIYQFQLKDMSTFTI